MFGIVFFAFAQLGYLLFGTQVKNLMTPNIDNNDIIYLFTIFKLSNFA